MKTHSKQKSTISSIHMKVFFSFAAILLLSMLITGLFGNRMMEQLYINNKSDDLAKAYQNITSAMEKEKHTSIAKITQSNDLLECLFEIEQDNVDILLFTLDGEKAYVHYFTRKSWTQENDLRQDFIPQIGYRNELSPFLPFPALFAPNQWIEEAATLGVFQSSELPLLITEKDSGTNRQYQTLDFYGYYETNDTPYYIFLRTPKEAVTLAAQLAVKYNLYIALATFVLMAITSYFVSRRITRPIAEISNAAERISQTDFSQPLTIRTGDELEDLSHNINDMAEKLQDYIYQLQLNQQLLEKDLEREARTSQMRKEFIANVSHDFKTPLTLIRAYTETIRNQNTNQEEHQQYCDIILNESERLNQMVTQLLQLSRLESGTVTLEQSYFPMEELMRDVLYRNQLLIQQKHLNIVWHDTDEDHIVEGDYTRIEQIVTNLIENAIKYTQDSGQIALSVTKADDLCHIAVTNSSPPLTEKQLENLFISFYKTDESRHHEQQSFGLGLAIVKATLDLHKQTCYAENTPDGLKIGFTLPLIEFDEEE